MEFDNYLRESSLHPPVSNGKILLRSTFCWRKSSINFLFFFSRFFFRCSRNRAYNYSIIILFTRTSLPFFSLTLFSSQVRPFRIMEFVFTTFLAFAVFFIVQLTGNRCGIINYFEKKTFCLFFFFFLRGCFKLLSKITLNGDFCYCLEHLFLVLID
jgi:hypothetical protein